MRSGSLGIFHLIQNTMEYWNSKDLKDIIYIDEDGIQRIEKWRSVPNYDGVYEASDLGRVKSLSRIVKNYPSGFRTKKPKILSNRAGDKGYFRVVLSEDKRVKEFRTNVLIAIVFLNHTPCGHKIIVDHKNNIKSDNRLCNLQLITQRVNASKDTTNKSGYVNICKIDNNNHRLSIAVKSNNIFIATSKDIDYLLKLREIAINNAHLFNGDKNEFRILVKSML